MKQPIQLSLDALEKVESSAVEPEQVNEQEEKISRLIPLCQWNKYYPYPPLGTLRWWAQKPHQFKMEGIVRRLGKRVLIDEIEMMKWLKNNAV